MNKFTCSYESMLFQPTYQATKQQYIFQCMA